MKKRFVLIGLILVLVAALAVGCKNEETKPADKEEVVKKETELLLGFESYEEITGAGLKFSSLFGKTQINKDEAYINEGEGSWMISPQGDYGTSEYPYFRMRLPDTTFENSDFMAFDKVMLDIYNASEEEISVAWSFNVLNATDTYTETETKSYTLAPNAWTTCEYDFTAEEYETFFNLDTVKLMTVNILSKKEAKDDTVNTLYLDNLRGHYAETERVMQDMTYDFTEGITFENTTDRYLFIGGTASSEYMGLSRVAYADTGLQNVNKELGSYALKGEATGATWPSFTVNFGETFKEDMILTFMLYVQVDEKVATEQTYFIESFYSQDNKTRHEVLTKSCNFNEWVEVNIRTTQAASSIWSYVNLDNGAGGSKCGNSAVTVYMDNFKVSEYKSDTTIAEDGTITISNPYNTSTHSHIVEKAVKKGELISFDIDFNTEEALAVWVLGDKEWLSEWYAYGYDKWEGKQKVTLTAPEDTEFFYIVYQYRGENADKRDNVCTISNITIGKNKTVVKEDGTVILYNEHIGGKSLSYTFDKPVKAGDYITFTIDVDPAQHMAVWLLGDDMWEDEWYAYGYEEWPGKQTISVLAPEDTENFTVQVEFRDNKKDFTKNTVTISDVKIGNNKVERKADGSIVLHNNYTGAKSLSYTFDKKVKAGDYITFSVDVDPAQHMAVWLLGDDMWEDEWYAYGYEEWPGKQTISVLAPEDTENFTVQVEFRDTTKDFSKNKVTISDVKIGNNKVEVMNDGSVVLYNNYTGAKSLSYTFNQEAKQGDTISFDVDVDPAQHMAVWLLGDDMWEDEWYAWGYETWTGKQTITVEVPSNTKNFTVQVEFRDTTKDFYKNVVTISNVNVEGEVAALTCTLEAGVLTISGDGEATSALLRGIEKSDVKEIRLEAGVTGIAANTFNGFTKLEKVYYANTVKTVADNAFVNCASGVLLRAVKGNEYTGGLENPDIHPYYSFKCVTIGSSYGEDMNTYLYRLAKNYYASLEGRAEGDSDYDEIVIAELFTGGGTLEQRVTAIMGNPVATCHYERWDDTGVHVSATSDGALSAAMMKKAMRDEYWDIVILMQSAENSKDADSFTASTDGTGKADMDVVIDFIKSCNKNDAISKYYWLQTWSYNYKLNDPNFASASGAEERQRLGIINSMQTVVQNRVVSGALDGIIPAGAAMENLKATCINVADTTYDFTAKPGDGKLYNNGNWSSLFAIQRDTAHASAGLGRFTLGLTAFSYLAGLEDAQITALAKQCYPKTYEEYEITEKLLGEQAATGAYLGQEPVTDGHIAFSAQAAIDAIASPYEVIGNSHNYQNGHCLICGEEEPVEEDGLTITGFAENRLFQDWIATPRWYIGFKMSTKIAEGEAAAVLGNYKVYINGEEKTVEFYKEEDGDLAVFLPATLVSGTPKEGTVVTIPAQALNDEYTLSKDYSMVYANNGWRELRTISQGTLTSVQRTDVFITTQTELAELYNKINAAYNLTAVGSTSGVYCNGTLKKTSIEYSQWGGLYFGATNIKGSAYVVGDVISLKGIFSQTVNSDVCYQIEDYYECTEIGATNPNNNLTQATWICKMEEPTTGNSITITGFAENRMFQDWITPTPRWYIAFKTSTKIAEGEAAAVLGSDYKVYINGEEKTVEFYKEADGDLVVFLPATLVSGTPEEGTVITIPAQALNDEYTLSKDYSIVYANNGWRELRTISQGTLTSVQRTDVFITTQTELAELYNEINAAYNLTAVGSASGVYCNGVLKKTSIEYSQWGGLYFGATNIKGSAYEVGDVVSLKGIFSQTVNSDVCYQIEDNYKCTAIGATNPNNNLTQATWEITTE